MPEGRKTVTTHCPHCRKPWSVEVDLHDFISWTSGVRPTQAFPYLNRDEMELFLTGYCTPCWDLLFKDDS